MRYIVLDAVNDLRRNERAERLLDQAHFWDIFTL